MTNGSGRTKRTRWTREVARQALEEWRTSGLPLEAYARRRGVVAQRLRWWRKQLGMEVEQASSPRQRSTLVPVTVTVRGGAEDGVGAALVLVVKDGGRLEIRELSSMTAAWVGELLGTLRGPRG
jgi:hypothetical protein